MNLTYNLKIKNNGPEISYDTAQYMLINIPANTTYDSISIDNTEDYGLECDDRGPIAELDGGAYSEYTGNGVTCVVGSHNGFMNVNEEVNLSVNLTATSDFTVGVDTLRASAFDPFNNQDPDYEAAFQAYMQGNPLFDVPVNNITNLVYSVNDGQQSSSDSDSDNLPNSVEDAAPNTGDANNDGTPDSTQPNVTSLLNTITNTYSVLQTNCTTNTTTSMSPESSDHKDTAYDYTQGLMNFTATGCGSTATITQYFYSNLDASKVTARKYNPTTNTYTTIDNATITNVTIGSQKALKVTYTITDNGPLDLNPTTGTITDPSGPAVLTVGVPNTGL